MPVLQFAVHSYAARALPLSAQRTVNYFAEASPPDAKAPVVMFNAPGIKDFATGLGGAVRGRHVMGGVLYCVAGNGVYSITAAGVATLLGTINTSSGHVSMASNRASPLQMIIVDGTDGWIYDTSGGLVEITDAQFAAADTVTFQDGYFILNEAGTSRFFVSAIDDGTSYVGTDFADSEASSDEVVVVYSHRQTLVVFNTLTTEFYYNSGNTDFPFERIAGGVMQRGCAAAFSVASDVDTLVWLGDDRIVYQLNGFSPLRISTHAIEEDLRKMSDVSDAFGFFITISGHKFYHITFPTGRKTYVIDLTTGLWHERESVDQRHWRGGAYVRAYEKDLIGDAFVGRIGELDMDTFTEFGEAMQGILTGPVIHNDRKRAFHRRFEIDIESGVGLSSGADPLMWLDHSDDGGRTWSARKPFRSMGKIGEYRQRLRWLRLGQARDRIYRLTVADPVKRSIIAAHADIAPGLS